MSVFRAKRVFYASSALLCQKVKQKQKQKRSIDQSEGLFVQVPAVGHSDKAEVEVIVSELEARQA